MRCPKCGSYVTSKDVRHTGTVYLWCNRCHANIPESRVKKYWETHNEPEGVSNSADGGTCESCGQSLSGGDFSLPWEDGNNANAYVRCRYCGHKNIKYGYGEDD